MKITITAQCGNEVKKYTKEAICEVDAIYEALEQGQRDFGNDFDLIDIEVESFDFSEFPDAYFID